MLGVRVDTADPGTVLASERVPTPAGTDAVLAALVELIQGLEGDGAPVGLGVPGLVDLGDRFRYGPNLPDVEDVLLGENVGQRLGGRSVVADNDATCAALAEFRAGAGVGVRDGVLLTIGTGIGAGLLIDGEIRHGANGFAGEPGHMVVDPSGPLCPCGRKGCWERFASGSGLGRLGRDAAVAGRLADAVARAGGDTEAVRGEHVVASARAGDADAGAVLDEFAWWMAAGVANLIDLLDPTMVILGGGVMEASDVLLDRVRAAIPAQVLGSSHRPEVEVVAATLGERAGAIGAAILAGDAVG